GEVAGKDYQCLPGGPADNPYLDTGGDIFVFPKQSDPEVEAAQLRMASMMVNPRVQALFNLAKGSLPIRDDVDLSLADSCMKKGLEILSNPENVIPSMSQFLSEDTSGQLDDLWSEFSFNKDMSIADAQERFATILENAN
ncbi:ABC transporter, substrate-binding protein (cluster 1, maltose/g3p/polyamine/iron), partial [hydrothermal vent metagenome]